MILDWVRINSFRGECLWSDPPIIEVYVCSLINKIFVNFLSQLSINQKLRLTYKI